LSNIAFNRLKINLNRTFPLLEKQLMKKLILGAILLFSSVSFTACSEGEDSSNSSGSTVQCSAITQEGARCLRMTTNSNGRCWQHQ